MSLSTALKQYSLGLICAKNLDDRDFLSELIGGNVSLVSHIYTNGANPLVLDYAQAHGIPYTTFPLTGGRSLPWSNSEVISHSDFIYVVATPDSKSAGAAIAECVKQKKKHRLISYEPINHWRGKVCKIQEILDAMPREDLQANEWTAAMMKVL